MKIESGEGLVQEQHLPFAIASLGFGEDQGHLLAISFGELAVLLLHIQLHPLGKGERLLEQAVGEEQKSLMSWGGALAAPSTAYIYNWNMLPIGQQLWLKELESFKEFPPLQAPESYNLDQVLAQVKSMNNKHPSQ